MAASEEEADINNLETTISVSPIPITIIHKDHPKAQIIREVDSAVQTRRILICTDIAKITRKRSKPGKHRHWNGKSTQEPGVSSKGRASSFQATKCLDTGGFTSWKEGHWIEAIRLFLAFTSYMDFTVCQMDVKSAFLYGTIKEEVYVSQPPGFVDPDFPNRVYKVKKALYGLHQALRAWYETLSTYLLKNGFRRGTIDKTLFINKINNDIRLVQVYVDDIIFRSTKKSLSTEFEQLMHKRFQMISMRELTFFLGLQVDQRKDGIFLSQDKYVYDILKKFGLYSVKTASPL
ncbi:retrovirus-related pol polyprotein from transposon TNT 1-94 [Tanacetum coccineum]